MLAVLQSVLVCCSLNSLLPRWPRRCRLQAAGGQLAACIPGLTLSYLSLAKGFHFNGGYLYKCDSCNSLADMLIAWSLSRVDPADMPTVGAQCVILKDMLCGKPGSTWGSHVGQGVKRWVGPWLRSVGHEGPLTWGPGADKEIKTGGCRTHGQIKCEKVY